MQRSSAIIVAIAFSTILANAALADGALAVGIPDGNLNRGFVYGATWDVTSVEAEVRAMNLCKGVDTENNKVPDNASEAQSACKVVKTFRGQCIAVTHNGDQHTPATGMGWSAAASLSEARQHAVFDCNAMRGGRGRSCRVELQGCDRSK